MAALQHRRQRWKCPECGIVNRAWRNVCFGEDCNAEYSFVAVLKETKIMSTQDDSLVEFKDENSKVIARVSPRIAAALRADIAYMMQRLVKTRELAQNKHENLRKTNALQRQMRTGQQVVQDFEDSGALWGYTRRKFSSRAVMSFELFSSAREALLAGSERAALASMLDSHPTVISIGGGPGNDMFGYLLFERYVVGAQKCNVAALQTGLQPTANISDQARLYVCDFASGWSPIVARVAELSGQNIQFRTCDLNVPLREEKGTAVNSALQEHLATAGHVGSPMVFVFCYVLSEVMGPSGDPPRLLEDLFRYYTTHGRGALFLFREPHLQALQTLLDRYEHWRHGYNFWRLSGGGLMVWVSPGH